ncbi:MAG: SMP-30/gluconolactonase/LRE family protein [Planctomycetota bacterium]
MPRQLPLCCFAAALTVAVISGFLATPLPAQDTPAIRTIPVGTSPESVCRGFNDQLFVTLINGDEPGDGTIVRLDGDNPVVFARGFNAPKGLVFVNSLLVTADETTLWTIDSSGRRTKLAEARDFPTPVEFLNDVAASPDGKSVVVSEMTTPSPMFDPSGERRLWNLDSPQAQKLPARGRIYRVTLDGHVSEVIPPGNPALRFPNGVAVFGQPGAEQVFAADFFTGNIVHFEKGQLHVHASGPRGLDGLTVTPDAFYGSSWTLGVVWKMDRRSQQKQVLLEGLKTAADFFFDETHKQLIVPDMVAGTLTFVPLK